MTNPAPLISFRESPRVQVRKHLRRKRLNLGMQKCERASERAASLVINCKRTLSVLSYLACAAFSLSRLHQSRLIILLLSLPACCGIYKFGRFFARLTPLAPPQFRQRRDKPLIFQTRIPAQANLLE